MPESPAPTLIPGRAPVPVYRGMDRAALDRQYTPSHRVPDLRAYLDRYARDSANARRRHPVLTGLPYGPHPAETLDYFPAPDGPAGPDGPPPLLVFVHGGNWQELSKDDSAFPAPPLLRAGAAVAVVGYGLAPATRLDDMVAMVRRAVHWLHRHADALGFAPGRLHLAGHSAGAHLAAMALLPRVPGTPHHGPDVSAAIAGATLLSGMYDLEPVRLCYVNDALALDPAAAHRNSPLHHLPPRLPPVVLARGADETAEYARQHALMAAALRRRAPLTDLVAPAHNHFSLPYALAAPGSPLGTTVLTALARGGPRSVPAGRSSRE
ncbi:alpha/beta hydrolase [Kitasatospora sp. NPDC001119]